MARVAVDAMGGDLAPGAIVAGAVRAHRDRGIDVLLVGAEPQVKEALQAAGADVGPGLEIVATSDVIAMDDPDPARTARSRRESSVAVASRLVASGDADAVFSAGSTGAALAAAVLEIGRIRGVGRPAIAVVLPFPGIPTVLLDGGANTDVRPEYLAGFAAIGAAFAEIRLGIPDPRVGLLSIGEEAGKGNDLVRAAFPLVEQAGVHFIGNVEGRDIPSDRVDVVVTDGFTGNVVLKLLEGFAKFLMGELMQVFTASAEAKAASDVLMPDLLDLAGALSPESHGGAQLLGIRGVCIIGHGSSNEQAVAAALEVAARTADGGLVDRMTERLRRHGPEGRE